MTDLPWKQMVGAFVGITLPDAPSRRRTAPAREQARPKTVDTPAPPSPEPPAPTTAPPVPEPPGTCPAYQGSGFFVPPTIPTPPPPPPPVEIPWTFEAPPVDPQRHDSRGLVLAPPRPPRGIQPSTPATESLGIPPEKPAPTRSTSPRPSPAPSLSFTHEAPMQHPQPASAPSGRGAAIRIDGPLKVTFAALRQWIDPAPVPAPNPPTQLPTTIPAEATPVPTPELPPVVSSIVPVASAPPDARPVPAVVESVATLAPATEARLQSLLLEAFGKALDSCQDRRGRDVLHTVLTAQEEQHASLVQVLADQRLEYGDQLERAVVRMSELMPESLVQAGEVFHQSAGKLTGVLSRIERLSGNQIEKHNLSLQLLGDIRADLSQFLAVAAEVRDLLAHSLTGRPKPRIDRRMAVISAPPDDPDDDSDILAKISDDLDEPEDIHGPH